MLSTEDLCVEWIDKREEGGRSEGTGRKEGAVVVGACVYIRERGEQVEDAQSVNPNAHTPGPRLLLLPPLPFLPPVPPPPQGNIHM
jgi:hypothetical protein